jgi:DNA polymerase I-like protein with 3'-5' exonuclease and polymerase domains
MIYFIGPDEAIKRDFADKCNIETAVKYCENQDVLGVDTETEGFDFLTKKMIMFQIGDEVNQFVIDTRYVSIEPFRNILESKSIIKILHNVKFDYKVIKKWADIELENVHDTMLAEQVIHCGKQNYGYGLKDLANRYLGLSMDKEVRNRFINLAGQPFDKDQIVYGANDVKYLCAMRKMQLQSIQSFELEKVLELENSAALAFADIEYNGIPLDISGWKDIASNSYEEALKREKELDTAVLSDPRLHKFKAKYIQADMFTPVEELRKVNIKWSSPTQVLKVFKTYLPELENVNGKEIMIHSKKFPIIGQYIKYKESMKLATSYGEEFLKNVRVDGRIHTSFNQILNTGRVASNSPNMQQIPADNKFRNCFVANEGYVYVSADYSSQELCIIAEGSKDPVWHKVLEEGQDLHSVCADLVYGEEWIDAAEDDCVYLKSRQKCDCPGHKKLRTNVKTVNFGLAYGMGPHKLAWTLDISNEEAEDLIAKYFQAFPSIGKFLENLGNYGKTRGHIRTYSPFRRIRWFENWFAGIAKDRTKLGELGSIERASKNTPIQGTGADMTKLALVKIREYLKANPRFDVKVVMTVHDQIDTICKVEQANEWKVVMAELMEQAGAEILPSGLLKADPNISDKWEK